VIRRLLCRLALGPFGILPLLPLAGCDVGPDYHKPATAVPAAFTSPGATTGSGRNGEGPAPIWPTSNWWEGFGSSDLNRLEREAIAHNYSVQSAIAAVEAADAAVRVAGGALLPTVSGSPGASWSQVNTSGSTGAVVNSNNTITESGHGVVDTRTYSATLSASYEIDFWGKNRATFNAAEASAMSARYAAEVTALTIIADVANTYFSALAYQDELAVARRNLAAAEELLKVEQGRLAAGYSSVLDVAQQAALVAGQRATIPNLVSLERQEVIALGILVGRPPEEITINPGSLVTTTIPPAVPGLPVDMLRRRPDVAEAEANLIAAVATTRAARAELFPSLTLSGSIGWENGAIAGLLTPQSLVIDAAASAVQTLFDNGALSGQVAEDRAFAKEQAATYQETVLQAYTDVETALTQLHYATAQQQLQETAVQQAELATRVARAQLDAGTTDITTLITSQETQLTDENTLVSVRLARIEAAVALSQALGGGWEQTTPATAHPVPAINPSIIP